ncbi:Asp-tRNA(Asn)/Glu-tRNA(Gln) amidotransferase subunit GatC [Candidatus Saccharibacteria bacterium]|nr:Asp-tRNA(Asn)/Glu-tRNA(Gln) amidotransferase subunit GatC [Candidatus Saccharibacteria bacterium]
MEITREEIDHLAKLSDFSLSEEEKDSLGSDLQNIIGYISQLSELDTEGVEPTYQVFEMENIWREDEILPQDADREELLNLAPAYLGNIGTQDNQIKVPKVL